MGALHCQHLETVAGQQKYLLLTPFMQVAHTIQYTQEQARALSGVSQEAWRHWRKVVPYLSTKSGKSARFSIGDIVVLSIMHEAVDGLGVGVGRLAQSSNWLFQLCATARPSVLATSTAVITRTDAALASAVDGLQHSEICLAVACAPILERLSAAAFSGDIPDTQLSLPFSPRVVGNGR